MVRTAREPPIGGIGKGVGFPHTSFPCPTAPVDADGVRDARRQPRSDVPGGQENTKRIRKVAASNFDRGCRDVDGIL